MKLKLMLSRVYIVLRHLVYQAYHYELFPRLIWPLMIYEVPLTSVIALEQLIRKWLRRWLGAPTSLTDVAQYGRSNKLKLPLKYILELHLK